MYAIATEDMDALTFATPRLIRHLCAAQSAKLPIEEYDYEKVLEGLKLTADQFVDLCILCGCDYCGSIKGQPLLACLPPCLQALATCTCSVTQLGRCVDTRQSPSALYKLPHSDLRAALNRTAVHALDDTFCARLQTDLAQAYTYTPKHAV